MTSTTTKTPPAATVTSKKCETFTYPKFKCPRGLRSKKTLFQLERKYLTGKSHLRKLGWPTLDVHCDGDDQLYQYP